MDEKKHYGGRGDLKKRVNLLIDWFTRFYKGGGAGQARNDGCYCAIFPIAYKG
jgi:hypothetical protein